MSAEYQPPTERVLAQARNGIAAVKEALHDTPRGGWYVYAIRSWEVYPQTHVLYVITPHTSVVLTRLLARALESHATWLSGTVESQVLPVDFCGSGDSAEPITAVEIILVVWPAFGDRTRAADGVSTVAILVDATDAQGVMLTLACERRPKGWPP